MTIEAFQADVMQRRIRLVQAQYDDGLITDGERVKGIGLVMADYDPEAAESFLIEHLGPPENWAGTDPGGAGYDESDNPSNGWRAPEFS